MDNKIKIAFSVLLSFIFSSCIGWLDNDNFYERTINDWISIRYWAVNNVYGSEYVDILSSNNLEKNIGVRINQGAGSFDIESPIIYNCARIIYNNSFLLAEEKRIPNPTDSAYYKLTPTFAEDKLTPNGYNIDTISRSKFDTLVKECTDCQELDADKIRAMDYELDHGGFPTKTVLFLLFVIAYIFFRIRKKKK